MRVWYSDHAVDRFIERVRPTLEWRAAAVELRRLVETFGERVERPAWCPEPEFEGFCIAVCDDVVVVCREDHRPQMLPLAVTVLARGHMGEESRERRNERRRKRPSARTRKLADRTRPSSRGDFVPSIEV